MTPAMSSHATPLQDLAAPKAFVTAAAAAIPKACT